MTHPPSRAVSRRNLLRAAMAAAGSVAAGQTLTSCGLVDGEASAVAVTPTPRGDQANDVRGTFSWRRAAGTPLHLLLVDHPYTRALVDDIATFGALTGIDVTYDVVAESRYFDDVTIALLDAEATYDAFMTGAYMVWQYGPPGWMEDLQPWLDNRSATDPGYDLDDIHPHLLAADRWNLTNGSPVGTGGQWAIPFGWESNVIAYQSTEFRRLGLKPPATLDDLEDVAAAYLRDSRQAGRADAYGLAVRGSLSWASVHAGFMTQFAREGGRDFSSGTTGLVPTFTSAASLAFHEQWMRTVRDSGPPDWRSYDYADCARDLATGRAGMMYDATSVTLPLNSPGGRRVTGQLAWSPGPAGSDGSLDTNLWVWSLAINSRSARKTAAWLWVQWATGREHLLKAALHHSHSDPVRASVADHPGYRAKLAPNVGYLDSIDAVRDSTRVLFTPQRRFFDVTTSWAEALHDIYRGEGAPSRLGTLSQDLVKRV
jgi:multiple sugar transport system substrate-binding protein